MDSTGLHLKPSAEGVGCRVMVIVVITSVIIVAI